MFCHCRVKWRKSREVLLGSSGGGQFFSQLQSFATTTNKLFLSFSYRLRTYARKGELRDLRSIRKIREYSLRTMYKRRVGFKRRRSDSSERQDGKSFEGLVVGTGGVVTNAGVGESSFTLILFNLAFDNLRFAVMSARRLQSEEKERLTLVGFLVALPTATSILPPIYEERNVFSSCLRRENLRESIPCR